MAVLTPVVGWRLEEATGAQRRDFIGANHLTDFNTVTQVEGWVGKCAHFAAASSQYLQAADSASLSFGNVDFYLCGRVRFTLGEALAPRGIWAKGAAGANEYGLHYDSVADYFTWKVTNGANSGTVNSGTGFVAGRWYFVETYHDAANDVVAICIDRGTTLTTAYTFGCADGAAVFRLGYNEFQSCYHNGDLDTVLLFNAIPTTQERNDLAAGIETWNLHTVRANSRRFNWSGRF